MPTQFQFRRGTTAQNDSFTGAAGEVSFDTQKNLLRVHDGSTAGGFEMVSNTVIATKVDVSTFNSALANTNSYIATTLANTNSYIATTLANTNAFIATKVNTSTFNSALANTNQAIGLLNTNLTSTNTAIRNLVGSNLANTNAFIATKVNTSTFNSALANTNSYIATTLANTNAFIATKVNTTTFNAALANTNQAIGLLNTNLTSTNTAIRNLVGSNLANTNAYIDTKVDSSTFNVTLANTNAYIDTKVNTTTFNAALANTNAYIDTKVNTTTFNAALANTNQAIANTNAEVDLLNTNLTSTNTAIRGVINSNLANTNARIANFTATGTYAGNFLPDANVSYDLGSNLVRWRDVYLSGTTIKLGDATISANADSGGIILPSGSTVSGTGDLTGLINDRMQVANVEAYLANTNAYIINTRTAFFATNTALRTIISNNEANTVTRLNNRMLVANTRSLYSTLKANTVTSVTWTQANGTLKVLTGPDTETTYDLDDRFYPQANVVSLLNTKTNTTTFNAALANTNAYIATKVNTTTFDTAIANIDSTSVSTNNAIKALISQKMSAANTRTLIATRLGSTATVTLTGDVTGFAGFSSNAVSITTTVADDSHNHIISNVDGLQTALNAKMAVANTRTLIGTRLGSNSLVTLTGDVTGTAKFASNSVSITTTIQPNSVALGTDTTGDYLASISGGTGVTVAANTGEGSIPIVSIGQDVSTSADVTFNAITTTSGATFGSSVLVEGDLTVTGNTISVSTQNLSVDDNLIYLNANSVLTNVDLGIAGNYNAGSYAHAGFFRDATDGIWKIFDSYTPEPDAAVDIDTGHGTFTLAQMQANVFIGFLSGTANTAYQFNTARNIALGGDLSGSASFDGSQNITITATVADDSHNHIISNVDGLQAALDNKMAVANTRSLANARLGATSTVTLTGDVTGSASFSANAVLVTATVRSIEGGQANLDYATLTSTSTSQQVADQFAVADYVSAKYMCQVQDTFITTNRQVSEVLVIHDGTSAFVTEYAIIDTNGVIATFQADVSGGNCRLLVTPTVTNSVIKVVRIAINA